MAPRFSINGKQTVTWDSGTEPGITMVELVGTLLIQRRLYVPLLHLLICEIIGNNLDNTAYRTAISVTEATVRRKR